MIGNFAGVLFDGVAYGSLLFLIGIGLSVTMGLMNFVNLAHGAFAMVGGYVMRGRDDATRTAVPRDAAGRVRRRGAGGHRARTHALPASLPGHASRPGAVQHRSHLHGGRRRDVRLRAQRSSRSGCRSSSRARSTCSVSISAPTGCSSIAIVVVITLALTWLIERTRFGAQDSRVGRQPAGRRRTRHQRGPRVRPDVRPGLGSRRPGRRARHRRARARADVSDQVHGVLPARGRRRRRRHDQGTARRRADPRRSSTSPASTTCRRSARS